MDPVKPSKIVMMDDTTRDALVSVPVYVPVPADVRAPERRVVLVRPDGTHEVLA